jgi:predicted nucleotidyltransferase
MGDNIVKGNRLSRILLPSWLDRATASLTEDIVKTLAQHRSDLLAVILYGSVARHDERPVDDINASDVDLLAIFDSDDELFSIHQGKALFSILGMAYNRHLDTLRDVKVMFSSRTMQEWDPTFIAGVARDGVPLWTRDTLLGALSAVEGRSFIVTDQAEVDKQSNAN